MAQPERRASVRALLLTRRGVAFLDSVRDVGSAPELADAAALELAAIGYVPSHRLRARLAVATADELIAFQRWAVDALLEHKGGGRPHVPLFRAFPEGVPANTAELWWRKVLVHYVQGDGQPCLFCGQVGTTHVLAPCRHVVCAHCWDGRSYSACPVCEHAVDPASPFFQPSAPRGAPEEQVRFQLLDLGSGFEEEARALFVSLCERRQALNPSDRDALGTLVAELGTRVLPWVPEKIPVRENVALVFGALLRTLPAEAVLPEARRHLGSATDVLRVLAVMSGTDGSLLPETVIVQVETAAPDARFWARIAALFGQTEPRRRPHTVGVPLQVRRFKMAKLPRPLRRALLEILEGMEADRLTEDLLRHRSYWVWAGEFLHPHEHAKRFPQVARAFQILRGGAPDGTPAPAFQTWSSRLEEKVQTGALGAALEQLGERPGELARRLDHLLRLGAAVPGGQEAVTEAFVRRVRALPTPLLMTLRAHLSTRRSDTRVRSRVTSG